jgi:hypothetical protein
LAVLLDREIRLAPDLISLRLSAGGMVHIIKSQTCANLRVVCNCRCDAA